MTKALDIYIRKINAGEEVPPVTLEERSPDLTFIESSKYAKRQTGAHGRQAGSSSREQAPSALKKPR